MSPLVPTKSRHRYVVSATDLKINTRDVLDLAQITGKTIVINVYGKPSFELKRIEPNLKRIKENKGMRKKKKK